MVWATAERLLPRLASAFVMFIAALFISPEALGIYFWGSLAFSLTQASLDASIRQLAVLMYQSANGRRFLQTYRRASMIAGPVAVLAMISVVAIAMRDVAIIPSLVPFALAPLFVGWATNAVAALQAAGRWAQLARSQAFSAGASLVISIPAMAATHSVFALALQAMMTELINAVLVSWSARSLPSRVDATNASQADSIHGATNWARQYRAATAYSLTGWLQSQADKLLVGIFAGSHVLGLYSFAWAISRSLGDAIGTATANVLRAELPHGAELGEVERKLTDRLLVRGLVLAAVACGLVISAVPLLRLYLSPEWSPALSSVPPMATATIAVVFTWMMTVVLVRSDNTRRALPARILGVVASVPIAIASQTSLELAAWTALGREVVVASLVGVAVGRTVLRLRGTWVAFAITAAGVAVSYAIQVLT